jgi:hypothetical protein
MPLVGMPAYALRPNKIVAEFGRILSGSRSVEAVNQLSTLEAFIDPML